MMVEDHLEPVRGYSADLKDTQQLEQLQQDPGNNSVLPKQAEALPLSAWVVIAAHVASDHVQGLIIPSSQPHEGVVG